MSEYSVLSLSALIISFLVGVFVGKRNKKSPPMPPFGFKLPENCELKIKAISWHAYMGEYHREITIDNADKAEFFIGYTEEKRKLEKLP